MLRCVAVDDEAGALEIIARYISRVPDLELVASFQNPLSALDFLQQESCDVLFLDIDMPHLTGLDLSRLLPSPSPALIICTAHSRFAVESYDHSAVDYLLKPIAFNRFLGAVLKVKERLVPVRETIETRTDPTTDHIFIKSGSKIHQLALGDILYMKKDGHYIEFHTRVQSLLSRMTMTELIAVLPIENFIRTHRSYVVAVDKIDSIDRQFVVIGKKDIPIGDSFRKEFFKRVKYQGN